MTTTALASWNEWTEDEAQSGKDDFDSNSPGQGEFKFPEGTTRVRILPPLRSLRQPYVAVWTHFVPVPGEEKKLVFVCPRMQSKENKEARLRPCPACTALERIKASEVGSRELKEAIEAYKVDRSSKFAMLIRGQEEKGAQIAGGRKTFTDDLLDMRLGQGGSDYTHPTNGYDILVTRKGTGLATKWKLRAGERGPIYDDVAEVNELFETAPHLVGLTRILDPREITRMWEEAFGEEEEQVAAPQRSARAGAARAPAPRGPVTGRKRTAADDAIDTDGVEVPSADDEYE